MPFDPTLPATNSNVTSAELRNQFTGLKSLIDAVTPPPAETDPVYLAEKGVAGGVATLTGSGVLPATQVPASLALDGIVRGDTTPAIDVLNSLLIAPDGTTIVAGWSLAGAGLFASLLSVNQMKDGANALTLDAVNRKLVTNDGVTPAVDWQSRQLLAADGTTVVASWGGGSLFANFLSTNLVSDGINVLALSAVNRTLVGADGATVAATWADGTLKDGTGQAFSTGSYAAANPGYWGGTPPATQAEFNERIAALLSNNGANPIP